jgi:hypothetical protein
MKKETIKKGTVMSCGTHGGLGLGIILLVLGLFFLAKDLGWIPVTISLWPILLIAIALYMLFRR